MYSPARLCRDTVIPVDTATDDYKTGKALTFFSADPTFQPTVDLIVRFIAEHPQRMDRFHEERYSTEDADLGRVFDKLFDEIDIWCDGELFDLVASGDGNWSFRLGAAMAQHHLSARGLQ